jgi:hypothetical protein
MGTEFSAPLGSRLTASERSSFYGLAPAGRYAAEGCRSQEYPGTAAFSVIERPLLGSRIAALESMIAYRDVEPDFQI